MTTTRHEEELSLRMSAHGAHRAHQPHSYTLHVLIGLTILRVLNAICTGKTFFQPDEYFQALEPAWNLAFGQYSGAWLTWVRQTSSMKYSACRRTDAKVGMEIPLALLTASSSFCRCVCCSRSHHSPFVMLASLQSFAPGRLAKTGPSLFCCAG